MTIRFEIGPEETKQANVPHEIFLFNLIGNHILIFIGTLGTAGSYPWIMAFTPSLSVVLIGFTLWRASQSQKRDPWYVMCHWQVAARRTKVFMVMLGILLTVSLLGWLGFAYGGMRKEAVLALVGGIGILPTMLVTLVLIIMESDALYHANQHKLPDWVVERFPNEDAVIIERLGGSEDSEPVSAGTE
jgi:hypothetical protein